MWTRCPPFAQAVTASALDHASIPNERVVLNWVTELATGRSVAPPRVAIPVCAARDDTQRGACRRRGSSCRLVRIHPILCYRGCPPIGPFIEAYLLVVSSGIGAVAGDFLGVVLTLRVLSVSVTQAPKARRDTKTKHRRMDFFIPTFYCKQARRQ